MRLLSILIVPIAFLLLGCPPPATGPGGGGPKRTNRLSQPSCGTIDTTPVGRKIHNFLVASAELDQATWELEQRVYGACRKMALALEVPPVGTTGELCNKVATELEANLEVSVSQETRLVTRTEPPVCTTSLDFAAEVAATCEANASVDIDVRCEGRCTGTCNGVCEGQCAATNADGSCAGACSGTCQGGCSGTCDGHAEVNASAECRASAEIRADVKTECTEPKVVVVREDVTVVDSSKLDKAIAAVEVGMPAILRAGAKAAIVAKATVHWAKTVAELAVSGVKVLKELGDRGVCVAAEVIAAAAASVNISARIDVSVSVSARFSAAAGAESQ